MLKLEKDKAFIENLRAMDERLSSIRLQSVKVERTGKRVIYTFICDKVIDEELLNKIQQEADNITPKCFASVKAEVKKVVSDKDTVERALKDFIQREFTSVYYLLEKGDVEVVYHDGFVKYILKVLESTASYIEKNGVMEKITAYLQSIFCDNFVGEVSIKEGGLDSSVLYRKTSAKTEVLDRRVIKVCDVIPIDNKENMTDLATYIEDAQCAGGMTLAGNITSIREKQTKTGKPFYIIDFTDKTGIATGMYFTRKNTADKIKELQVGDGIIAECTQDYYNERLSLKLNRINRCTFPADFVPQRKREREMPDDYTLVFPTPNETVRVVSLLDGGGDLPECLLKNDFVVFDLETTGLIAGTDKITEIGAVKIEKGIITQLFNVLIDPKIKLSEENIRLTGITQNMVDGQPTFDKIIGDFYKFAGKNILVGHNIGGFDMKMLRAEADHLGYYFDNKIIDTYPLAINVVPGLANYKLNTVAQKFGVEFRHHRALSDAYATAEIFLELIKIKKCLPNF